MNRDRTDLDFDPASFAFGPNAAEWRHHDAKQGLTWRLATLDDVPRLNEIWAEMDRRTGTKQDKPDQFRMPVLLTLVAVSDDTGKIESAFYGECVVDWTMIGTSRRVARSINGLFPYLQLFLFPRSIRVSRMLVPRRLERQMEKLFPAMTNITQLFAQFVFYIRS